MVPTPGTRQRGFVSFVGRSPRHFRPLAACEVAGVGFTGNGPESPAALARG
jgi:hypothetical protein